MKILAILLSLFSSYVLAEDIIYVYESDTFKFSYGHSIDMNTPFYLRQNLETGRTFGKMLSGAKSQLSVDANSMGGFFSSPFEHFGLNKAELDKLTGLAMDGYFAAFREKNNFVDNESTANYDDHKTNIVITTAVSGSGASSDDQFFACIEEYQILIKKYLTLHTLNPLHKDKLRLERKIYDFKPLRSAITIGCTDHLDAPILLPTKDFLSLLADELVVLEGLEREAVKSNRLTLALKILSKEQKTSAKARVWSYLFERISEESYFNKTPVGQVDLEKILDELKDFDLGTQKQVFNVNGQEEVFERKIDFEALKKEVLSERI